MLWIIIQIKVAKNMCDAKTITKTKNDNLISDHFQAYTAKSPMNYLIKTTYILNTGRELKQCFIV